MDIRAMNETREISRKLRRWNSNLFTIQLIDKSTTTDWLDFDRSTSTWATRNFVSFVSLSSLFFRFFENLTTDWRNNRAIYFASIFCCRLNSHHTCCIFRSGEVSDWLTENHCRHWFKSTMLRFVVIDVFCQCEQLILIFMSHVGLFMFCSLAKCAFLSSNSIQSVLHRKRLSRKRIWSCDCISWCCA